MVYTFLYRMNLRSFSQYMRSLGTSSFGKPADGPDDLRVRRKGFVREANVDDSSSTNAPFLLDVPSSDVPVDKLRSNTSQLRVLRRAELSDLFGLIL